MKLPQATLALTPTSTTERIVNIDMLRGAALFGILVVNIFYFGISDAYYARYFTTFTDVFNTSLFHIVNYFFSGKFYPIFSFLFGLGFFIQFFKSKQKGIDAKSFLIRRLTILLFFGMIHIFFVWEEDILFFYALFGFALLFLADQSSKVIIITAVVAYMLPTCWHIFTSIARSVPPNLITFDSLTDYITFYTTASYWQILQIRLNIYATKLFTVGGLVDHFDRLAFFLVGFYAGKTNLIADLSSRKTFWGRLWITASIFGIFLQALWLEGYKGSESISSIVISQVIPRLFLLAQIFTYIIGFLLLLDIKRFKKWFQILANPGRMALTNYLMHTTAFSLLFYSYGFGLYASLSPIQLMIISILFFTFQVAFSNIWLSYFGYGPLEWVWRSLTYQKMLPLYKTNH